MPDVISAHTSPRQWRLLLHSQSARHRHRGDILRQLIRFREYEFAYFLFPGDTFALLLTPLNNRPAQYANRMCQGGGAKRANYQIRFQHDDANRALLMWFVCIKIFVINMIYVNKVLKRAGWYFQLLLFKGIVQWINAKGEKIANWSCMANY